MKRLNLFKTFVLMAASMLMFSSCQKDPEELLVGKWIVVSSVEEYFHNGESKDVVHNEQVGLIHDYREDGTLVVDFGDETLEVLYWTYADDVITLSETSTFADYIDLHVDLLEEEHLEISFIEDVGNGGSVNGKWQLYHQNQ